MLALSAATVSLRGLRFDGETFEEKTELYNHSCNLAHNLAHKRKNDECAWPHPNETVLVSVRTSSAREAIESLRVLFLFFPFCCSSHVCLYEMNKSSVFCGRMIGLGR